MLCEHVDIVARCQVHTFTPRNEETNGKGGNNAGHTIVVGDKKYDFHILPSGTFFSLITEFG